jgi:hypothetical protein
MNIATMNITIVSEISSDRPVLLEIFRAIFLYISIMRISGIFYQQLTGEVSLKLFFIP